jgi:hypothetical protein
VEGADAGRGDAVIWFERVWLFLRWGKVDSKRRTRHTFDKLEATMRRRFDMTPDQVSRWLRSRITSEFPHVDSEIVGEFFEEAGR